jgi:hypothetical protein
MSDSFVDAGCKLCDAVIFGNCTIAGSESYETPAIEVERALAVLEMIRASEEFSPLHGWAERQMSTAREAE